MPEREVKRLPIGMENFEKIRAENFYYVDKTGMIRDLLHNWGEVNLITRPRRFGKSLNMSMLKCFFEIGAREELFEGLEISAEKELCGQYLGQFPVISVSLKGVNGNDYPSARAMLCSVIGREAARFPFLRESSRLNEIEKKMYDQLTAVGGLREELFEMSDVVLIESLYTLCALLAKHYDRKVIVLVDEYDVPLAKANENGYYGQMTALIRSMFERVLKTNENLYFAVLTGCLRVAKESIFTGLNNFNTLSIMDAEFDEYFGFTEQEVQKLLAYFGLAEDEALMKEWYDGYHFGSQDVYCPWDVICRCARKKADPQAPPEAFWSNTSSNTIVRHFIESARAVTKQEIERLTAGEYIVKKVRQELTYRDMYDSIDNMWSVLFMTGYLTQCGRLEDGRLKLVIPNKEVKLIFEEQISAWFQDTARKDGTTLNAFCEAFQNGDEEAAQKLFSDYLRRTISIRDTAVRDERKENYFHGLLLGLLSYKDTWHIMSNKESGEGYSDIMAEIDDEEIGIVIEVKYAADGNLEKGCRDALRQIEERRYDELLYDDGMKTIWKYGVACWKKRCRIEKAG